MWVEVHSRNVFLLTMTEPPVITPSLPPVAKAQKRGTPWWLWVGLFLFAFIVIRMITRASEDDTALNARFVAETWLKENAHDPSSVEIVDVGGLKSKDTGDVVYLVKFRAKNPFGALVLTQKLFLIRDGRVISVTDFAQ